MTDRERLIGLIGGTHYGINTCSTIKVNFQRGFIEKITDHLLANGVTARQWVSVEENLPKSNTIVLVFVRGYVDIGWYDGNHDEWRASIAILDNTEVTHWMPLPQPPKGE